MTPPPQPIANPYVGPRTFTRDQGHLYFGRELEAQDLLARVLSERLVLFYAQSGAGKSSLINTRLIPNLWDAGYVALPVARVGGEVPAGIAEVGNIFLFNLMLSLDQSGANPQRMVGLSLSQFLAGLGTEDGEHWAYAPPSAVPAADRPAVSQPYVLIVDQFEEIITGHPGRWEERAEFFRQLNQAMLDDPDLWVVLTLREDYIAPIEPYAPLLTDRMRARFYMERMDVDAALQAVRKPAGLAGRPFAPGVAEQLVDNLRQVRVPGLETTIAGQYVEPVQLQVVCYQLWDNLDRGPAEPEGTHEAEPTAQSEKSGKSGQSDHRPPKKITFADLATAGNVDQALTQFYEESLAVALADPAAAGIGERQLRAWFDEALITEAGARGLVHQGKEESGGLPNGMVRALQGRFLVRTETRGGDAWIELVHDRLVEPIRASNAAWFPQHLSTWQRQAALWKDQNRPAGLLLQALALALAEAEAAAVENLGGDLEPHERDFLEACRQARAAAERERRQSRIIRGLGVAAVIISILALGAAGYAWKQTQQARENADLAEARIAQVGQLVGDLGMERLLAMASQLDQAGDSDGAATLLQTAVNLNPTLLVDLDSAKLTTDTLRLMASVSLRDVSGGEYAFIPAGAFTMGSTTSETWASAGEMPAHSVYLSGYWMGRAEVTNGEYAAFVEATGHEAPYDWKKGSVPSGQAAYPVVNVSWNDAVAYTQWLSEESGMGFRLCTEAEWEKACRGTDSRIYPWGDTWDASKANVAGRDTTPVGKYSPEGDSPYGVADMSGNAWEWVADWYGEDYYASSPGGNPQGPETGDYRVLRGGSFDYDLSRARCAIRFAGSANSRSVGISLGLRVCVSPGL